MGCLVLRRSKEYRGMRKLERGMGKAEKTEGEMLGRWEGREWGMRNSEWGMRKRLKVRYWEGGKD